MQTAGPSLRMTISLLRIRILEAVFSGMTTLMSQPFMALGRQGTVTLLQAVGFAAAIPLLFVLVLRLARTAPDV
jgi:Na+-driven multidrug efflux pump